MSCWEKYGYLIFGVEDGTHEIVGTTFRPKLLYLSGREGVHLSVGLSLRILASLNMLVYSLYLRAICLKPRDDYVGLSRTN